ncbi:hypothetical protein AGABI2DRAFT_220577 [Agaricus bisporus var. bisporus H97]|uniref:hypothetical protein n=1 Tax=Agaricus bisporus var. bisporus (strain H97 / ATCC MYA-4626 / FGSC 10389) TaxID=936046 RepID=UPI00029F7FFA|nr:hypothetical protein AGABI2DRAFT_220577 [Agaricus bisporus var. bisporus H97]EKV48676.1 hypothetical protein AGABI2DRAFT_220577 [Agaricus bisporus var. bisporus H97]
MQPLEAFFRKYRWFIYVPGQSASAQFKRLRDEAGWDRDDDENDRAWQSYRTALVRQFNATYSVDEDDLAAWHALLRHIGVNNPPSTVEECKKLINGKFINLIDLIDARDHNVDIIHFATEQQLSEYTRETKKIFPREHEEAGTLLRYLLRHIMHPDPNRRDPTQFRGSKKNRRRR